MGSMGGGDRLAVIYDIIRLTRVGNFELIIAIGLPPVSWTRN